MDIVHCRTLTDIEEHVCDIAAEQLQIPRNEVGPASRLIDDLHCDSLCLVELMMALEDSFGVSISARDASPVCKSVFTRAEFRLSDLAEVIYIQQGTGKPERNRRGWNRPTNRVVVGTPFCQLGGKWSQVKDAPLFEPLDDSGEFHQYRRRSDGMRCVKIPAASVQIGTYGVAFDRDATPPHDVELDTFLIDAETVSTTAYCRFLNSIGNVDHDCLMAWFLLTEADDRSEHVLVVSTESGWQPLLGCEEWPMILVSWFGANAYSLWANAKDWRAYRNGAGDESSCCLPTEAQWEYAARGPEFRAFPWGDEPASDNLMNFGRHTIGETYTAASLPLAAVKEMQGMSPFGLHHMAGNVWQWCRDWYDDRFYSRPEANERNAFNRSETGVRAERGGSWVGPAELCRSSHRRGRSPNARGRCLGFRCISDARDAE